jgi:hypothetical protein
VSFFIHAPVASYTQRSARQSGLIKSQDIRGALIAHWPLDQANGPAEVISGFSSTYSGTQTFATDQNGVANGATDFESKTDTINIYSAAFDAAHNAAEGTVTMWLKAPTSFAGVPFLLQGVMAPTQVQVTIVAGSNFVIQLSETTTTIAGSQALPSVGDWFFAAMSWSATHGRGFTFQEGTFGTEGGWTRGAVTGALTSTHCLIGAQSGGGTLAWNGLVSDLKIYNRAASLPDLLRLESAGG